MIDPKPAAITEEAFTDLKGIGNEIRDPERTLIFCRHGLEWWVAWDLHVKIAMAHVEINEEMESKYDHMYVLVQKKGENHHYPGMTSPFEEPVPPEHGQIVYQSDYFDLYELTRD